MTQNSNPPNKLVQKLQRHRKARWLFWAGTSGLILLLGWLFSSYYPESFYPPLAADPPWNLAFWVSEGMDWLIVNFAVIFDAIKLVTRWVLNSIEDSLLMLHEWSLLAIIVLWAWRLAGRRVAIFSGAAMYFIGMLGLWELCMSTLALIATAVLISMAMGIPIGILAARSDRINNTIRPVLDVMQTMPAFVYLIPAVMFFGLGNVPGVMATVIFAAPPAVRLTNLGIRQVPKDLVEAGHTFGSTDFQLLFKVQLPLALPSIMAGINQTIMLSLSMVVLAAMIAAGGLGREVYMALGQVDIGRGFVAGTTIVLVAMVLDRITQSLGQRGKRGTSAL
ncbi:MAG: proline/glycine betaine ABC transporter permease [Dehalococcoidales bacterium]|jgi:glycine betaine/proline transport system permease protein|nr:proline/glycine betaine ABC transporter permease [Dehalococcoidales bacterium]MDP6577204.1 proline/glycine betaine ABC transporter permease [Dehalococcoidales bacterium]MDP6824733.1 proline/glycine betaine ABC transporter permease [Dehalococcoidales bacterium]